MTLFASKLATYADKILAAISSNFTGNQIFFGSENFVNTKGPVDGFGQVKILNRTIMQICLFYNLGQ